MRSVPIANRIYLGRERELQTMIMRFVGVALGIFILFGLVICTDAINSSAGELVVVPPASEVKITNFQRAEMLMRDADSGGLTDA